MNRAMTSLISFGVGLAAATMNPKRLRRQMKKIRKRIGW
ncbi:DUF3918 family protein [Aeribacillus pallidus]|nr:DUF3918 family protein [Bacillus sp. (in: firmicutes)]